MPIQSTSEGKISLAKGVIFTKIGLANGYILKLWAAPPNRNLAENPPPVGHRFFFFNVFNQYAFNILHYSPNIYVTNLTKEYMTKFLEDCYIDPRCL